MPRTGHTPRKLSRPGLSMVDANAGRLITYTEDVANIKHRIENELWPGEVSCAFDLFDERWVIIYHQEDGTDSLLFSTPGLSEQTIERIHRSDQTSRSYVDLEERISKEEKERERALDHRLSEQMGDAAERLYSALVKDGVLDKSKIYFAS